MNKKKLLAFAIATLALFGVGAGIAFANPSYFAERAQTSAATSSPAYFATPGTATSTVTYNSASSTSPSSPTARFKADVVTLLVQFAGKSPTSVLNLNLEYSGDCIDYYRDFVVLGTGRSTTTGATVIGTPNSYTWTFASSTLNGVAVTAANGATSTAAIQLNVPTQCMRAVFTMTGNGGAVWAQFVPIKQQQ